MMFAGLLFFGLIALVGVWLIRGQGTASPAPRQPERQEGERRLPTDILRERYARGEISREEYEQMRRDLDS